LGIVVVVTDEAIEALRAPLADAMASALAIVREAISGGEMPTRERLRWVREEGPGPGQVSLRQEPEGSVPDPTVLTMKMFSEFEGLPETETLLTEIRSSSELRTAMLVDAGGTPLDSEETQSWWVRQFVLVPFLSQVLSLRPDGAWDEDAFGQVFEDLVHQLAREPLPVQLIAPLEYFQSDLDDIELDEQTRIRRLDEELLNEIGSRFGEEAGIQYVTSMDLLTWSHVVRHEMVVADPGNLSASPVVSEVVTALRLLRESGVRTALTFTRPLRRTFGPSAIGSWSHGASSFRVGPSDDLVIADDDVPALAGILGRLREIDLRDDEAGRRFELALSRVNTAAQRRAIEDRLIDYWVAIEALFVPDSGGEISFRARTRVARFITTDLEERKRITKTLSRSYGRRSQVVHGDTPHGDTPTLTQETGELLRRALRSILEEGTLFELDELDLG
jgi:hypothetical protein